MTFDHSAAEPCEASHVRRHRRGGAALGIHFSDLRAADIAAIVNARSPRLAATQLIVTANVDHVVRLRDDREFQRAYDYASIVTTDGIPVYCYTRLRRCSIPERVTGHDLVREVVRAAHPATRFFFVADSQATADGLVAAFARKGFPAEQIGVDVPPFGFENDPSASAALVWKIASFRPDLVFMGVGAPKSEKFVYAHRDALGPCWAMCVGDAIKVLAETGKRAPGMLQNSGMEWVWRLAREPRRLWRRYLWDSRKFLYAAIGDLVESFGGRDRGTTQQPK